MEQMNLDIEEESMPTPALTPKQIQALISVMADAIVAVLEHDAGAADESE